MNLSTGTVAGYRLLEKLTDRPNRAVFQAVSPGGAAVIVKVAEPGETGAQLLRNEVAKINQLQGAAVAPALESGTDQVTGLDFLVLEPGGESLADRLASRPEQRFSAEQGLLALRAMAEAVQTLHDRDWIHGDLKPSNVLFAPSGEVTLIDLECSRSLPVSSGNAMVSGTPPFLPPEVLTHGEGALSKATDVWALGIILHLTTTGEYPFGTGSHTELASRLKTRPPLSTQADLPPNVLRCLERLLAFDPQERPADAAQVAALLDGSIDEAALVPERSPLREASAEPAEEEEVPRSYDLEIATVFPSPEAEPAAVPPPPPAAAAPPAPTSRKRSPAALDLETVHSPSSARAEASEDEENLRPLDPTTLKRSTAARWFRRMNPHRSFELSVFFSAGKIHVVPGVNQGVNVSQAKLEIDAAEPDVEVEPHFPGCLVTPARMRVDLSPEIVTSKFWITPLAQGEMKSACVNVYYRGKLVDTLSTPTRVVGRTSARITAAAGICWPLIYPILEMRGWSWSEQVRQEFPLVRTLVDALGTGLGTLILMGLLLSIAAILFRITRPLPCEDVLPVVAVPKRDDT